MTAEQRMALQERIAKVGAPKTQSGDADRLIDLAMADRAELESIRPLQPGDRVLDVGCGYGRLGLAFVHTPGVYYVGMDICHKRLDYAFRMLGDVTNIGFVELDLFNQRYNPKGTESAMRFRIKMPSASVAGACMISVFTHMPNPAEVKVYLGELSRVLQPGAPLITTWLTDPPMDQSKSDTRRAIYQLGEIDCMLGDSKFQVVMQNGRGDVDEHLRIVARRM